MNPGGVKSPFKFLDPFGKNERTYFFGRDKEVRQLYDFVNKNRVVLVYGESGTGKTSVIQCGLANEFETSDWNPFFIRKEDDINASLLKSLKGEKDEPSPHDLKSMVDALFNDGLDAEKKENRESEKNDHGERIFIAKVVYYLQKVIERFLRPVYLIFDQFEELLILGTDDEKRRFIKILDTLLGPNRVVDCNIIIVMREEYFAALDAFERDIPGLSDRRIRIEPMRAKGIKQVILDSCKEFNITLSDPESNVEQMIAAVSKNGDISLPYLQVYLDQLWHKDYQSTYPDGYHGNEKFVPLKIETKEISEFGMIKDVMQRFAIEQRALFQKEAKKRHPEIPDNFFETILDCFVNEKGTKRPNGFDMDDGFYVFSEKSPKPLREAKPQHLKFLIDYLARNQILRNTGNCFELTHDIFAKLIDQRRDARQKRLNGIREMIVLQMQSGEEIPYDLVKNWESDIDQVELSADERSFFERCQAEGKKKEHERLYQEELNKAIEKEKMENLLARQKREADFNLEMTKREAGFNLEMIKKRKSNILKFVVYLSVIIISAIFLVYWNSLKKNDAYHAFKMMDKLDVLSMDASQNQNEVLFLAKYAYDYGKRDSFTKRITEERISKLLSNTSFARGYSKYSLTLNSAAGLIEGLDVDISGNGKFIIIKNDSLPTQNASESGGGSRFDLISIASKALIKSFSGLTYAYFLNRSDTLLLALSPEVTTQTTASKRSPLFNRITKPYLDKFILYDCANASLIDTIRLNGIQAKGNPLNFLYDKNYLNFNKYSEWDSYKVKLLPGGRLVIPYTDFPDENQRLDIMDLRTRQRHSLYSSSSFSVSISKQYDKILYCYYNDNSTICKIYHGNGEPYQVCRNPAYSDFTDNGSIVYAASDSLFLCDDQGKILEKQEIGTYPRQIYADRNSKYALITTSVNVHLVSFSDTSASRRYNERLVGYNFKDGKFITATPSNKKLRKDTIDLIMRDFSGKELKRLSLPNGIESFSFNPSANNILLKTNKIPSTTNNNFQILYLLDDKLDVRGSFFLTPNDAFSFSKDGRTIYYVRDNELAIFDNKKFQDLFSFKSVNDWLEQEKENVAHYKTYIRGLRKKYGIDKFPSQIF